MGPDRLVSVKIRLEGNPERIFYSGQEIVGTAKVKVSGKEEGIPVKNLEMRLVGKSEVLWSEARTRKEGNVTREETIPWRSTEVCVDTTQILFPRTKDGSRQRNRQQPIELPPGSHSFPFKINLPVNLPSSFNGAVGSIRYSLKLTVNRWWALDKSKKTPISVVSMVDLNRMTQIALPVALRDSQKLASKQGEISSEIRLPRSGFVPGEDVAVSAVVTNKSKITIAELRAELKQSITYIASNAGKKRQKTLTKALAKTRTTENVKKGRSTSWLDKQLRIPSVPPWNTEFVRNIIMNYWLEFTVVSKGAQLTVSTKIPLTVGAIPLSSQFSTIVRSPKPSSPPHFAAYPNLPPPTYTSATKLLEDSENGDDESIRTGKAKEKEDKSSRFSPKYPIWTFSSRRQ